MLNALLCSAAQTNSRGQIRELPGLISLRDEDIFLNFKDGHTKPAERRVVSPLVAVVGGEMFA